MFSFSLIDCDLIIYSDSNFRSNIDKTATSSNKILRDFIAACSFISLASAYNAHLKIHIFSKKKICKWFIV